jgi:hypothetical protein
MFKMQEGLSLIFMYTSLGLKLRCLLALVYNKRRQNKIEVYLYKLVATLMKIPWTHAFLLEM